MFFLHHDHAAIFLSSSGYTVIPYSNTFSNILAVWFDYVSDTFLFSCLVAL